MAFLILDVFRLKVEVFHFTRVADIVCACGPLWWRKHAHLDLELRGATVFLTPLAKTWKKKKKNSSCQRYESYDRFG